MNYCASVWWFWRQLGELRHIFVCLSTSFVTIFKNFLIFLPQRSINKDIIVNEWRGVGKQAVIYQRERVLILVTNWVLNDDQISHCTILLLFISILICNKYRKKICEYKIKWKQIPNTATLIDMLKGSIATSRSRAILGDSK